MCGYTEVSILHSIVSRMVSGHQMKQKKNHAYHEGLPQSFSIWFVRLLALRPLLAYCGSLW
jgi:hypothetical protein